MRLKIFGRFLQRRVAMGSRCAASAVLLAGLVSTAVDVAAATIVSFTFDDGGATFVNAPNSIAEHLSTSAWSDADGTLTNLNGLPPPGRAVAARSWHDTNHFEFTLTVTPGHVLALTAFAFDEQGSSGAQGLGPTAWSMTINALEVANGSAVRGNPGGSHADALTLAGLTGDVVVRIFALGSEDGDGTAANATWRIDNFSFTGMVSAVPVPAASVLLGSALFGLGVRRRRTA